VTTAISFSSFLIISFDLSEAFEPDSFNSDANLAVLRDWRGEFVEPKHLSSSSLMKLHDLAPQDTSFFNVPKTQKLVCQAEQLWHVALDTFYLRHGDTYGGQALRR
jgi:hypothetical protein